MTSASNLRLVVAGSFGFLDIGDEAMLTEDLHFITSDLGMAAENITLFGHNPDYVSSYHKHPRDYCIASYRLERYGEVSPSPEIGIKEGAKRFLKAAKRGRIPMRRDAEVQRILASADAALITGGGTINTREPSGFSVSRMSAMISAFKRHDLPIFISGQTIGPLGEYAEHDALAKDIVAAADVLTVRDRLYSRRYLDMIGAKPKRFLETFDDAYTLQYQDCTLPNDTAAFINAKRPTVAVNVTDYTSETFEQRSYIAALCDWLGTEEDTQILLLSHTPRDLVRLFQIFDMCDPDVRDRIHLPDARYWTGGQLKKAISGCKAAVGGRYHFIVFAGTSDTPFVGMSGNHYSYIKQHGFADPLGLSRFILTERQTHDFETLKARIREALALSLELSGRFRRPSESMVLFEEWIAEIAKQGRSV